MAGYGLIRRYLLGEATEGTDSPKPAAKPTNSGYKEKQVREMERKAKPGTALKAVNTRRKAMDEILR